MCLDLNKPRTAFLKDLYSWEIYFCTFYNVIYSQIGLLIVAHKTP